MKSLGLPRNYEIAIEASIEAASAIMQIYSTAFSTQHKEDGSPVTAADLASSKVILQHLAQTGIPVIGEESKILPYETRKNWSRNWCVDPLDGTKEFIKKNDEFCICIALIELGRPIFGLICSPVDEKIIFGGKDVGVHLWHYSQKKENLTKIEPPQFAPTELHWIGSRSHKVNYKELFEKLQTKYPVIVQHSKGSALKFFDLALNKVQFYPRFAPTMEWDIAAGQAILEALGGEVIDVDTKKSLNYNKESLFNPHFIGKTLTFILAESV
jgi:3'(2'), 5'-bisphosphate nucleotidase